MTSANCSTVRAKLAFRTTPVLIETWLIRDLDLPDPNAMSDVLNTAIEFTVATNRWSSGGSNSAYMTTGTLWYGMMCRSFVLLERLLRCCLREFARMDESLITRALRRCGSGKPLDSLTMGQCLAVLSDLAPALAPILNARTQTDPRNSELFPERDRQAWKLIIAQRNRMAHDGPGFVDSVDLFSGRTWRRYQIEEPLDKQAAEVWRIGRQLCRSRVVLTCVELQGISPERAVEELERAESVELGLKEISARGNQAIDDFHEADPEPDQAATPYQ